MLSLQSLHTAPRPITTLIGREDAHKSCNLPSASGLYGYPAAFDAAVTIIEYHVFHMFCNLVLVIFYKISFAELYSVSMENKRILC